MNTIHNIESPTPERLCTTPEGVAYVRVQDNRDAQALHKAQADGDALLWRPAKEHQEARDDAGHVDAALAQGAAHEPRQPARRWTR